MDDLKDDAKMKLKPAKSAAKPATKSGAKKKTAEKAGHAEKGDATNATTDVQSIINSLKRIGTQRIRDDMKNRYGVTGKTADTAFGVGVGAIQKLGKSLKSKDGAANHALAAALWEWQGGQYEARMLATFVDDPALVTAAQMDRWAKDFDNWAIVDTACFKLFDRVPSALAFSKIEKWARSNDEFTKRAAFALLACVALHDKTTGEEPFANCLPLIERHAGDDRNFVKKGVSWALRSIGRRSPALKSAAVTLARRLVDSAEPAARWTGKETLKDLGAAGRRAQSASD